MTIVLIIWTIINLISMVLVFKKRDLNIVEDNKYKERILRIRLDAEKQMAAIDMEAFQEFMKLKYEREYNNVRCNELQ